MVCFYQRLLLVGLSFSPRRIRLKCITGWCIGNEVDGIHCLQSVHGFDWTSFADPKRPHQDVVQMVISNHVWVIVNVGLEASLLFKDRDHKLDLV